MKALRYFEEGAREYWLFDPERRTAEFLRRGAKAWRLARAPRGRYATPHLPGFVLDLAAVWRRLDQKSGRTRRPRA